MPLQITADVFRWLQGLSLVKQAHRNQNNLMEVAEQESARLMDGFVINILFRNLFKSKTDEQKLKKLDSLKQNSTPAIRLYNWGILTDILKQVGYNLEYADKSKITNYDPEPLAKIINFLYEVRAKDPNLNQNEQKMLKVDIHQIGKKGLKQATNVLQFLTISISKNFKISPQQTLNLFLDNNKYLSHLLAKGVKNSYEPVYALLNQLKSHAQFIVAKLFCLDEQQNATFILNALRTCFISKDQRVAYLCCQFVLNIYDQYMASIINLQHIRKWLKDEGLNTLFFSIKKHPLIMGTILTICYNILDDQFFKFIQLSQKSILWTTQKERFIFYKSFVQEASQQLMQKFSITNYFQDWNKLFIKSMKKTKDNSEILLLIAIMEQQWNKIRQKFEQNDMGIPSIYINFLKTIAASPNQLLFIQSSRTLFSLMQSLGAIKNPFAPLIYKILVSQYSTANNIEKIVYMSQNFIISFKGINGLPGSPLIQPLLKHLQMNKEFSVIELAKVLIQQRRIDEQQTLDLIEMMTKIAFSDIRFGSIVLQYIFVCINNLGDQVITGFLQNNTRLCLAQLFSISRNIIKSMKILKQQLQRMKQADAGNSGKAAQAFILNASKHILCKNMVGFLSKSIFIDDHLKDQLESSVFHTYIKIKVDLKKAEQAELLKPIMATYYPQQDQMEAKLAYYMNIAYPPKPPPEARNRGHSHDQLSRSLSVRPATQSKVDEEKQKTVILDPASLKPSNFAIKDLQKLKQKRYELKTIEAEKQKQKVLKQQRVQKFRTIQYEKRLVQSMTSIKNDVEYNHIQTMQQKPVSVQPQVHQNKEVNVVNIKLINLQKQQEESYVQEVDSILKRYKKVWRYLFFKYSIKKSESGGEQKAHMGDVWKLLRDYEFTFLKKQQSNTIVRLINEHMKRKNDIQFLNYQGFQDFILQVSVIGFGKLGYFHLPPGQQLLMFIDQLKRVTKEKSGSIQIFQNPQQAYFQQTEVIRQFNKRLKQNSDYILPQGYKKTKQTSLEYQYEFHPMLQKNISKSYIQVWEVLDSIFSKNPQLGFHLVEPLTIKSETFLAKPCLFQGLSQKMKDYTKGYLQPKKNISASSQKDNIGFPSPPIKKQFKPFINFSLGIKLGIAETSLKNKSIAEEVAYCMQDILNAIENQSPVVKKGNRKKITNQIVRRRKIQLAKIELEKKKQQVNWKRRADSVKLQVQILRQKRRESQKKKKQKEILDRKKKKEKQQKFYKQRIMEFDKVKAKIAQKKETLLQMKAVEQQKIQKQKQQYKIGVEQYFRKKREEIKQKQQEYKKKKAQQKQKKEETQQNKKSFVKKLYLANLKKQQQVLQKVDQIKQTYDDVWKSTEVQQVFTQNKLSLKLLFDLLLKYQKSKISATNYDQIGLGTLNFFCLKFKIIPFMLQKQDINKIFMYATKEDEQKQSRKGINFQKFLQTVFLIATKAKKLLNKMAQKRKKKQKKIQAFLNAQKSAGGNHYQTKDVSDSSQSEQQQSDEDKPTLQDTYLFNAEDVSQETISQVIAFLKLPKTKADMEQRYKQAMETKTSKPKNMLIKQIKQSLEE